MDLDRLAGFYGSGADQLHLAFNFPSVFAPLESDALRNVVERTEELLPERAWPAWTLSNHDIVRFPTRMCANDERKARAALLALLTQRGTPVLYQGDELAMPQVEVSPVAAQRRDPDSFLSRCRELIARRRSSHDLLAGTYQTVPSPPGVWAYRRGEGTVVAVNLSKEPAEIDIDGKRRLAPWEGVLLDV